MPVVSMKRVVGYRLGWKVVVHKECHDPMRYEGFDEDSIITKDDLEKSGCLFICDRCGKLLV